MTGPAATITSAPGVLSQRRRGAAWGLAFVAGLSFIAGVAKGDPPPHEPASQASSKDAPLPEVTIRAQREELERQLRSYVGSVIRLPFEESLARWTRPICPLVAGLPPEGTKIVESRLSEIVAAAGAHLAKRPCQANFAVIVTAQPDAVLKAWYTRDWHLFGEATEHTIDRFIETPQPVRVWYNINSEGANSFSTIVQVPGLTGAPEVSGKGPTGVPVIHNSEASRLVFNAVRAISSVIVTIDSSHVRDLNLGQLTDYAALVGLVEVRPHTDVGDTTPTILRLFTGSEEAAPTGLTAWDTAFLKALYNTDHKSKTQRDDIFLRVLHDIAP